jgi:hypothetical protein
LFGTVREFFYLYSWGYAMNLKRGVVFFGAVFIKVGSAELQGSERRKCVMAE